jgi:hypothetical protein
MSWRSGIIAATLVLAAANINAHMAFGRGMSGISGGAHFTRGGFARHRFAIRHGLFRPFRRNFAGGFWPYDYDYVPTGAYGDIDDATAYPGTVGFAPEAIPRLVCHRSEELVRVPSEGGGSSQIKIIRCP